MMEVVAEFFGWFGWGKDNLAALFYGACLSTVVAWVVKYPARFYADRHSIPLDAYKWFVRTIAGAGAIIGTYLTWPERGRAAWLAGVVAWVLVDRLYKYSSPIIDRFFPWASAGNVVAASKARRAGDDTES